MERPLAIMARADDRAGGGRPVRVRGAVDGVDVHDRGVADGEFEDQDAAFEVPGDLFEACGSGGGVEALREQVVAAREGADAVDLAAEAARVVFVAGEAEVRGVGRAAVGGLVFGVRIRGAGDGREGFGVVRGDLDFLQAEYLGPGPAAEAGSEGGAGWVGWWRGGGGASGTLFGGAEVGGYGGLEEGRYSVDVPGEDAEEGGVWDGVGRGGRGWRD